MYIDISCFKLEKRTKKVLVKLVNFILKSNICGIDIFNKCYILIVDLIVIVLDLGHIMFLSGSSFLLNLGKEKR